METLAAIVLLLVMLSSIAVFLVSIVHLGVMAVRNFFLDRPLPGKIFRTTVARTVGALFLLAIVFAFVGAREFAIIVIGFSLLLAFVGKWAYEGEKRAGRVEEE